MKKSIVKVEKFKKVSTKSSKEKAIKVNEDVSLSPNDSLEYSDIRWKLPDGSPFIPDTSGLSLADYYKMTKDYQVSACINTIAFTIQQIDWDIKCEDQKVRDFLVFAFGKIWNQLIRGISQAYWAGFSPMVKVFTQVENGPYAGKIIIKKLKDLDPTEIEVSKSKEDGSFEGMKKGTDLISAEYCFWYTFLMKNGNYYGTYLLEAAYMPYYYSQVIHLFANRYYERFGEPLVKGMYPEDKKVNYNGDEVDAHDYMADIVKKLRNHSSVTMPSTRDESNNPDWVLEYLESNMRGVDFETYLKRLDIEKARAIFVPDLLFGSGRVGSYKLGDRHTNTFLTLLNSLIGDIKDHIDKYILPQLVDYNFSKKVDAFWSPEQLGRSNAEMLETIVREMIRQGMATVNVVELGRRIGLDLKVVEKIVNEETIKNETIKKEKVKGGIKQTAVPDKKTKEKQPVPKEKQQKKNYFFRQFAGKNLTEREASVNFSLLQKTYDENEKEMRSALIEVVSKQQERVEETVKKAYNEGNGKIKQIKLGYRGAYEKIWQSMVLALYLVGAEEEIKRSDLKVKDIITKEERNFLEDNAALIAKTQLDDLENKINEKILQINDLKVAKTAALAIIASVFNEFSADNSSLDKSLRRSVVWGVRQGKVAVAERSGKEIMAKVWSAILDDHVCPLCEKLHGSYIKTDSEYFSALVPPAHYFCRCEEIIVYEGQEKNSDEKKFVKPSKELINKYGGLLPSI